MTLYKRLVISSILLVSLAIAISTTLAVTGQTRVLNDELIGKGKLMARQIALSTEAAFRSTILWPTLESTVQNAASAEDVMFCKVVMPDGTVYIADDREYYGESIEPGVLNVETSLMEDYVDPRTGKPGKLIIEQIEIGQERWWVLLALSSEGINEAARSVLLNNLLAAIAIMVPAIAGALVLSRGISGPIVELAGAAEAFAAGRLDHAIDIRAAGEVGVLARSFNAMTEQLRELVSSLEQRVADRTADLQQRTVELEQLTRDLENAVGQSRRRALRLEASAQVASAVASVLDPDKLLSQVVDLVADRVGYYHVGVFLLDETSQYAVLRAANSVGGQRMLARGHRLQVGEQGIVGYVTGTGRPRIVLDVGADAVYFDNPDLPQTRSEMALPLVARGRILGALDVQSVEVEAFGNEDVAVLGTLASQVAVALDNARLFEESRNALREMQRIQAQYTAQAWRSRQAGQPVRAVEYTRPGVSRLGDQPLLEADRVAATGETLVTASDGDGQTPASLVVPLKLYGRTIGVLGFQETEPGRVWTEDEIVLAEAVADQIAQTLESARLFEEAQQRAWQEQSVSQITAHIRASTDVEDILQTAAEELGRTLGVSRAIVRLSKER